MVPWLSAFQGKILQAETLALDSFGRKENLLKSMLGGVVPIERVWGFVLRSLSDLSRPYGQAW